MKKLLRFFILINVLVFSCGGGDDVPEEDDIVPEPTSCRIISSVNNHTTLNYNYGDDKRLVSIDYEITEDNGTLLITWDDQDRLSELNFGDSKITLTYFSDYVRVNNDYQYVSADRASVWSSGILDYYFDSNGQYTHIVKDGVRIMRFEYFDDGNMNKVYTGLDDDEILWGEFLSFDDKKNPTGGLPLTRWVTYPGNQSGKVVWQIAPWEANQNNSTHSIQHTSIPRIESTCVRLYNDLGYPTQTTCNSTTTTYTYECE